MAGDVVPLAGALPLGAAKLFLRHRGVEIFHVFRRGDPSEGVLLFVYATTRRGSFLEHVAVDPSAREEIFDVRELPGEITGGCTVDLMAACDPADDVLLTIVEQDSVHRRVIRQAIDSDYRLAPRRGASHGR